MNYRKEAQKLLIDQNIPQTIKLLFSKVRFLGQEASSVSKFLPGKQICSEWKNKYKFQNISIDTNTNTNTSTGR